MSGKCLLDTNIVIALFANEDGVKDNLAKTDEVFVSSIVIGELFFGAHKSARTKENITRINEFAESNIVLACDAGTASFYGEIKNALRLKGHPIPENDIWIAAIALQHGLTLISRDAHFSEIENLEVSKW
ncbi:MAG: VapC toxin family PIN domain ribonuclease [Anaerolineae bacterium CG03_land_8_20_14_0_80_58_20]|nr:MAG: VapC toxin family PIN domain ribonuclease [Anaerolineae bacterium CG1_02_58_13]PIV26627.1 MAG: VapC toxin family PIN domain ribonuclease [Anaerolineae bacterium CG03_land_8_20_14_0_80_58_20]